MVSVMGGTDTKPPSIESEILFDWYQMQPIRSIISAFSTGS